MSKLKAVCLDCGVDTLKINEFYMVRKEIWLEAVPDEDYNMTKYLCIGCLEGRLKRRLLASDFADAPINWLGASEQSDRLVNRVSKSAAEIS